MTRPVSDDQSPVGLAERVRGHAAELGFDACGFASALAPIDPDDRLGAWLRAGYHADMDWIARTADLRRDPRARLPGCRSVVVVARNYFAPRPAPSEGAGRVSRYAWGRDYHRVLGKPLKRLAAFIRSCGTGVETAVSVDTGPVLERAWAQRAGIGWVGKNGLLIHPGYGSWVFLGVVLTTLDLPPAAPAADRCGACRACLDACPAGAIVAPRTVDSRRCLSYQTVENRGDVPLDLQDAVGLRIFGCDACQEACPWNRRPVPTREAGFQPREGHANPELEVLLSMGPEEFEAAFRGTCIRRAGLGGLQRNARIVLRNMGKGESGRGRA